MPTITKRNDTYKITVSCGYDSTGKQIRKHMTWKAAPGMTKKQTEKELQRQAVLFEEQCQNGQVVQTGTMKLSDFIPQYMDIMRDSGALSPTTMQAYERIISNYINPTLGHIKLKDLKPIHVQKFIQQLSSDVRYTRGNTGKKGYTNEKLKPATIRRYYVVLQSILGRASKLGLIASNPANSEKIDLPPLDQQEIEIFTKEEASRLLQALEEEPLTYKTLIHLAIITGARRGELVALQWDCIDFNKKTITIRQSNYKLKGEEIKTKTTKSKKIRTLAVPDYCLQLLMDYRYQQMEQRFALGDQWHSENWVFTQWDGKPMNINTPSHWFRDFLIRRGLPERKFHALRHTSATLLLTDGTDIKTVASRLGHSQLSTTNIYLHSLEEADQRAAQSFESILNIEKQAK